MRPWTSHSSEHDLPVCYRLVKGHITICHRWGTSFLPRTFPASVVIIVTLINFLRDSGAHTADVHFGFKANVVSLFLSQHETPRAFHDCLSFTNLTRNTNRRLANQIILTFYSQSVDESCQTKRKCRAGQVNSFLCLLKFHVCLIVAMG